MNSMCKSFLSIITFSFLIYSNSFSQTSWTLNFKPQLSFPVSKNNGYYLNTGFGYEITVGCVFNKSIAASAGWANHTFPAEKTMNDLKVGYDASVFMAGIEFLQPLNASKFTWIVGIDALAVHLSSSGSADTEKKSGNGGGWRVNTGISSFLIKRIHIMPGISYSLLSARMNKGESSTVLRCISPGLRISYQLKDK